MKTRSFDPRKLDVAAFARDAASLEGEWPAATLQRLADAAAPDAPATLWPAVRWSVEGEYREARGSAAQIWLHLQASTEVSLSCQRCLKPVQEALTLERSIQFVPDEAAAAELDADAEHDVLELTRSLDLAELIEDELLLALPLVPRHEVCPEPLPRPLGEPDAVSERPNPFAALAALKKAQ